MLALAALNLALALLASTPLSAPLARFLDDRPAAVAVADAADDGPRLELLQEHPELLSGATESALLALVIGSALSLIVAGGLLSRKDDDPFAVACARNARRMLAIGAAGLPLRLLASPGGGGRLAAGRQGQQLWRRGGEHRSPAPSSAAPPGRWRR